MLRRTRRQPVGGISLAGLLLLVGLVASLPAAMAAPPSAVDQYTERPPTNAGGTTLDSGDRGQTAGGGSGGAGGGGGAGAGGGSQPPSGGGGEPTVGGEAQGSSGSGDLGATTNAGGGEQAAPTRAQLAFDPGDSGGGSLPGSDFPLTTLAWIVLAVIAASLVVRAGMAIHNRAGNASAAS